METSIFEDFIEYCKEDNEKLAEDIETWLADFFDLPNRNIPLEMEEENWICKNLSEKNQLRILGYKAKGYNLKFNLSEEN
jgi:hypothetical protein